MYVGMNIFVLFNINRKVIVFSYGLFTIFYFAIFCHTDIFTLCLDDWEVRSPNNQVTGELAIS